MEHEATFEYLSALWCAEMVERRMNLVEAGHQRISVAYFVRHKGYVLGGMISGLLLMAWLNRVPSARTSVGIWLGVLTFVLNCTFGGRTLQGHVWRMACLALIAGIAGSIHWGLSSALGVVCGIIAVAAGGIALCLRWNVPPSVKIIP